jgi:hypothetical protein
VDIHADKILEQATFFKPLFQEHLRDGNITGGKLGEELWGAYRVEGRQPHD